MTTDLVTIDANGEVIDAPPIDGALNLFGATPRAALAQIGETATLLTTVLRERHLYATIQGKNHVTVEGWTLLGALLGVFPIVTETWRVTEPGEGFKARCEARTIEGKLVGAGEALCTRDERTWAKRDDFALLAMAQTRATSRAMRNPLGFVVKMAGYETAGAEEMPAAS